MVSNLRRVLKAHLRLYRWRYSFADPKIAALLRGGMLPMAYVYPPEMRSARDLMRRRVHLMRKRAELLTHIKNTASQHGLPEISVSLAARSNREGIAERFSESRVRKSVEVDLALIDFYDDLLRQLELYILRAAKQHDVQTLYRLQSIWGTGKILALVMLYEIHDIRRFPRVQNFVSYCRLVKCAKESAGKRTTGSSGRKIGNAHLKWAFSEAAALFLRGNPAGQKYYAKLTRKHGKGKALTSSPTSKSWRERSTTCSNRNRHSTWKDS